jgi:hypothetical protein
MREAEPMKVVIKLMIAGAAVCALAAPAFAYTLSGVLAPGQKNRVLTLRKPIPAFVKLTMTAPPVNAGVDYAIGFCIGPRSNPCGLPDDWTVDVPKGQTVVRVVPGSIFTNKIFVVGQGTAKPVPYRVDVEPGL